MRYTHKIRSLHKKTITYTSFITILAIIALLILLFNVSNLDISSFFVSFLASLEKVVLAYFISLFLALFFALVTVNSKKVESILLPILDVLQSFPSFALLPLLLIYLGKSFLSVLVILIIAMIWPILFAIITGFKAIREELFEAASVCGAKGLKRVFYFTIPAVMPSVLSGSIVAWGEAWETVIGAEIILNSFGLGNYFLKFGGVEKTTVLLVAILGLLLMLFIINKLFWLPLFEKFTKYQTE